MEKSWMQIKISDAHIQKQIGKTQIFKPITFAIGKCTLTWFEKNQAMSGSTKEKSLTWIRTSNK